MTLSHGDPAEGADDDRASHHILLRTLATDVSRSPDAIVVAATRPAHQVATAADVANRLGCLLVVLCSHNADARRVGEHVAEWPELRWLAVDLPTGYEHRLLDFKTSTIEDVKARRLGDLSVKRNLSLLLARLAGWRSLLFLDDDIVRIDATDVGRGTAVLGPLNMVGLLVSDYPDNSVVCHANRLAGHRQDVFASGAALLVHSRCASSFFPEIYNEDWLFMFASLARRRVAISGSVTQLRYKPFATPRRAEGEEFGDVLAEGLIGLLQDRVPQAAARDADFWRRCLHQRREFIERIACDLEGAAATPHRRAALAALAAAEARRAEITPGSCAAYIRTWQDDRMVWARRMAELDRSGRVHPGAISTALDFLGLRDCALSSGPASIPRTVTPPDASSAPAPSAP